jgi:hypothetical protein
MLTAMGMDGFAERARRELLATGETVRKRTVETLTDLTAQREPANPHIARRGRQCGVHPRATLMELNGWALRPATDHCPGGRDGTGTSAGRSSIPGCATVQ